MSKNNLNSIYSDEKVMAQIFSGNVEIVQMYLGTTLVWSKDEAYSITLNIENAKFIKTPGSVLPGGSCELQIAVTDENIYKLPSSISVTGASLDTYNADSGEIKLSNAYSNITINGKVIRKAWYIYDYIEKGTVKITN